MVVGTIFCLHVWFSNPRLSTGVPSNRSDREVRFAGLALQMVWGYKDLRRTLEKDGWKKTDFTVNLNAPSNTRANGGYEDSTLPLINNGQDVKECMSLFYTKHLKIKPTYSTIL